MKWLARHESDLACLSVEQDRSKVVLIDATGAYLRYRVDDSNADPLSSSDESCRERR
jgi:hypothetical protein